MKSILTAATLLLLAPALRAGEAGLPAKASASAIQKHWFNGAEISRYDLTQSRYGSEHPGYAVHVFVTEPFLPHRQVKDESGTDRSVAVLKLNEQRTFNTGIYPYHTMMSVFDPIAPGKPAGAFKVTTSVQEWCGHAFMQTNRWPESLRTQIFSYFEKEEGGEFTLPAEALLEDELWTRLRLEPSSLPLGDFEMVPGSLYLRFAHREPKPEKAKGEFESKGDKWLYRLAYPELGRSLVITFRKSFPYIIEGWVETDREAKAVTSARLTHRLENQYYWQENQPEHRVLRQKLGLREMP